MSKPRGPYRVDPLGYKKSQQALDKMAENARELGLDYEPAKYSDIVSDGGLDPRNKFDKPAQQEPVGEVGSQVVRFHMYKEILPVGTKLYTSPPAQQEPVACQYAQDVAMPEYRCVGRCQYDTSPPAQQQEPVAAECKFDRDQKWVRCEIAHHNLVQSEPHNWPGYQTRLLYTSPPAPVQQKPDWLDKEQTETDWDHVWLLIKAASYASSRGFISGTSNWGSAVSRYMRNESPQPAQQQPIVEWLELLREARDNCKASIVEEGISASRKEYRIDLEARLTAALNTSPPPQRKPLTDEEIGSCIDEVNLTSQYGHHHFGWHKQFARAIEAAHGIKEKNT